MPVFLHQNVIRSNEISSSGNIMTFHTTALRSTLPPAEDNLTLSLRARGNDTRHIKNSFKTNKLGQLPKIELKQVFKDIFESSVVGGKERHEKIRTALGKDPEISESLIHENARVGALFASKAFVQLAVNPIVGIATEKLGYQIPFLLGTTILFLSSLSKLILMTTFIYNGMTQIENFKIIIISLQSWKSHFSLPF